MFVEYRHCIQPHLYSQAKGEISVKVVISSITIWFNLLLILVQQQTEIYFFTNNLTEVLSLIIKKFILFKIKKDN